jgi:hypothetical protein
MSWLEIVNIFDTWDETQCGERWTINSSREVYACHSDVRKSYDSVQGTTELSAEKFPDAIVQVYIEQDGPNAVAY